MAIITEPNEVLRKTGALMAKNDLASPEVQKFIDDLAETMYASDGVGIAAPQTGRSVQICVIAKKYANLNEDLVLVNPVWQKLTTKRVWDEEGCLSVPHVFGKVNRYDKIKVNALDRTGKKLNFQAQGFFARIIQHEVDHLNGILFIDKARDIRRSDQVL